MFDVRHAHLKQICPDVIGAADDVRRVVQTHRNLLPGELPEMLLGPVTELSPSPPHRQPSLSSSKGAKLP